MNREELIQKRKELLAEVEKADEKRFSEIQEEIRKIDYLIEKLDAQHQDEQRHQEIIAGRNPSEEQRQIAQMMQPTPEKKDNKEINKRNAKIGFAKQIKSLLTGKNHPLTDDEKRAVGVATTTTATNYVAPSESVDGVNNGGIFIPQNVMYDLIELDDSDSPFFMDVNPTSIKGAVIFPYVAEESKIKGGKKEKVKADSKSIKWDKMTLPQGNYPLTIEVTMELLAMTDEEFADYLISDLKTELDINLSSEVLYGSGKENCIEGVTVGIDSSLKTEYEEGNAMEAIKLGLGSLSRRARKGACLYISRSLSLALTFEKDKNGNYIFPIYNSTNINSIATVPVKVDEALNAGDFIIGNAKNYKLNYVKSTEIYPELKGKERVIEYTAHMMVAGKGAPKKFFYGTLKEASETNKGNQEE